MFISGRPFYACPNREGGCGFFLWADDNAGEGGGQGEKLAQFKYNTSERPYHFLWTFEANEFFLLKIIVPPRYSTIIIQALSLFE